MSGPRLDPALDRVLLAARDRRERRGTAGNGQIPLGDIESDEALALDALLAVSTRRRPVLPGKPLTLRLSEFEAALRACSFDPRVEYERVGGRPLRDLPAERAAAHEAREGFRAWLLNHETLITRPALAGWVEVTATQGRLHSGMRALIESALQIVAVLPTRDTIQRTVLAARLLEGDPHALDAGTPLHNLVVPMLIADAGLETDMSPRNVWAHFNVLIDPASSNALTLGLPLRGHGVVVRLVHAAAGGHVVITHGQIAAGGFDWPPGMACFTCENPSVLIAAEQALGTRCRPLICTGGHPSDAVRLLLGTIAGAGGAIYHHGDFDEAGLLILRDLQRRYAAQPWHFDVASLDAASGASWHAGPPREEPALEWAVTNMTSPVPEELVLDALLEDLRN